MSVLWITLIVVAIAAIAFALGRRGAIASTSGDPRRLHSLPSYYGWFAFMTAAIPAFLILIAWLIVQPLVVEQRAEGALALPDSVAQGDRDAAMRDVRTLASAMQTAVGSGAMTADRIDGFATDPAALAGALRDAGVPNLLTITRPMYDAARAMRDTAGALNLGMAILVIAVALAGAVWGIRRCRPDFRARNSVERVTMGILMLASLIAILTTVAIVFSMVFETVNFFRQYPWTQFFFGTTWSPVFQGQSQLGILPLLWGTLYVSLIALLVAVPIGIFSAIYLSEYATRRVRAVAKPLIEILAGIPTIVYGLFALITVGPLLRDYFAQPLGLGSSGSSVMTAGLVMGIMIIPFVSSLSDDIINAVPQSLRDGSLGLGATPSETIRKVVLPAALPGIVGAVLLAASRAIGETMIVVLGAGAAARMDVNPFEAMTTITVKIVSQLTGDTDFNSPETLVAFALGLTLFVITLGLNILALYIVRTYREQYE
ncbi:phosphate ABC transporter permease subunit PstC [Falsirhodobacter halotolerans]|uniref:phosphate ABC transporter permease subunit PstC n=1 Tax=Falsirhodobacter halotolerans TaxID=1146892 RepID=UPI001FD3E2E4|nr:phosphate ABC transporter permease subunit PstC [Falsirhodobacter halotolerans]MCJ8139214.1 phosphate ABC transporter permease subunit PstC [Falsirhodobacter halotolerans]